MDLQKTQEADGAQVKVSDNLVGQMVADRYELIKMTGLGGFSQVYLGKDRSGKLYSIKVSDKNKLRTNYATKALLLQKLHMMMQFNHPAIPKVFDIIEDEQHMFVVRECVDGYALSNILSNNGPLEVEWVVSLGTALTGALQYLRTHTPPYIYLDMKPANVVVTPDGIVKLINFGNMVLYNPDDLKDKNCLGTNGYAAPELCGCKGRIDPRTDIYGLGVTLHQCVTGINPSRPPYETPPICRVNPALPKGLEYIISKCIELNPNNRYQSCAELITDLQNYQSLPPKKRLFGKKK